MELRTMVREGAEQVHTICPVVAAASSPPSPPPLVAAALEGPLRAGGPPSPLLRHVQSLPDMPSLSSAKEMALSPSLTGTKLTCALAAAMQGTSLPVSLKSKPQEARSLTHVLQEWTATRGYSATTPPRGRIVDVISSLSGSGIEASPDECRPKDVSGADMSIRERLDEGVLWIQEAVDKEASERSEEDARLHVLINTISDRMDDLRKDFQGLMDVVLMELRCLVQEAHEAHVLHTPKSNAGGHLADLMPVLIEDSLGERISRLDEAIERETAARVHMEEQLQRRLEASLQELRVGIFLNGGSAPNVLEEKLRSQSANSSLAAGGSAPNVLEEKLCSQLANSSMAVGQPPPQRHLAVNNMLEEHCGKMPIDMMSSTEQVRLRLVDCWKQKDHCVAGHTKVVTDGVKHITVNNLTSSNAQETSALEAGSISHHDHDSVC